MSKYEITAPVRSIGELQSIPYGEGKTFEKRTILLEDTEDKYNDVLEIECGDKLFATLDSLKEGQVVTVHANLSSRENRKKPGQYFTGLKAWRIETNAPVQGMAPPRDVLDDDIPF